MIGFKTLDHARDAKLVVAFGTIQCPAEETISEMI